MLSQEVWTSENWQEGIRDDLKYKDYANIEASPFGVLHGNLRRAAIDSAFLINPDMSLSYFDANGVELLSRHPENDRGEEVSIESMAHECEVSHPPHHHTTTAPPPPNTTTHSPTGGGANR